MEHYNLRLSYINTHMLDRLQYQATESATGVVQGDDQQRTGLVSELMTADGSFADRLLTGYSDWGVLSQKETAGSTQSSVTTTLEEAETKDLLENTVTANALLPDEDEDGQSSDAVADIRTLFCGHTSDTPAELDNFAVEQRKDPEILDIIEYAENGTVPEDARRARRLVSEGSVFVIVDGIAFYVDPKRENRRRAIVPQQLRKQILANAHSSRFAGHFSGRKLYDSLLRHWWWRGMFQDATAFARSCPECAVATGSGRRIKPPLQPIPVSRPFQILGIDVMDLPLTDRGNSHVVVVQDLFTKCPFAFPVPDQKTERIARLLVEEVTPCFGVPEARLSDRGTNLLSHLMLDMPWSLSNC